MSTITIEPSFYTPEQIAAFNESHDRKYGWTFAFPKLYPRRSRERYPEMFFGKWPEDAQKDTERWVAKQQGDLSHLLK